VNCKLCKKTAVCTLVTLMMCNSQSDTAKNRKHITLYPYTRDRGIMRKNFANYAQ